MIRIAFGVRQPEVAADVFLGVLALLETDDRDPPARDHRQSGHDRGVVAEAAVAVELDELVGHELEQFQRVRPLEVAGLLDVGPDFLDRVGLVNVVVAEAEKTVNHWWCPPRGTGLRPRNGRRRCCR